MKLLYSVHSVHETDAALNVKLADGRTVEGRVPSLVVELVSACGGMGHTFRLQPEDMAEAKAQFVVGSEVTLTFEGGGVTPLVLDEVLAQAE